MLRKNLTLIQCDAPGCERMWLPDANYGHTCFVCYQQLCTDHAKSVSVQVFLRGIKRNDELDPIVTLLWVSACSDCVKKLEQELWAVGDAPSEKKAEMTDTVLKSLIEIAKAE